MAPAIGYFAGHQRRVSTHHVHNASNDIPSSIRAVQTVSNLSTTTGHLKPEDRESFEQLLSEILSSSDDGRGDGSAIETNLVTNYNLVTVVSRAGLENLVQDDPFSDADHLLSVASRSLSVLKIVFGKVPGVLFYAPAPSTVTDSHQAPLYIWLLPRLLALIGRPQTDSLQFEIVDLLGFAVRSVAKLASPSGNAHKLVDYLKGCIRGMHDQIMERQVP